MNPVTAASSRTPAALRAVVPSFAGWQSFPRACANLLLFALVASAGTWLVHQTEYAIEYGGRFSSVMQNSPHRFYMLPLGATLGTLLALAAVALLVFLLAAGARRLLPHRSVHRLTAPLPPAPVISIALSTAVLVILQASLYLYQENAELLLAGGKLPGLAVLFAPQHITVLPLHFLVALCAATWLWLISAVITRSQQLDSLAAVLRARAPGPGVSSVSLQPQFIQGPNRPAPRLGPGLRAPPIAA